MADQSPRRGNHPKIAVYTDDDDLAERASRELSVVSTHDLSISSTREFLNQPPTERETALVVLDIDDGRILGDPQVHEARRSMNAATSLMIISRGVAADHLRDVIRLNAVDSVHKPLDRRNLLDAVTKSLKSQRASARVVAFVSASAGAGASTLAMNAAYLAADGAEGDPHGSMLFELDFSSGSIGGFLDIGNDYSFTDVLSNPARIDAEFVDIIRKEHPSGFFLLSMKAPMLLNNPMGSEVVLRILDVLNFQYQTVIVDIPYYATGWRSTVLEGVNDVVVVTESTIPALKQARDTVRELEKLRGADSFVVACNKHRSGVLHSSLSKKEIMRVFDERTIELLPDAPELMEEAANQGKIPLEYSPRSPYSKRTTKFLRNYITAK